MSFVFMLVLTLSINSFADLKDWQTCSKNSDCIAVVQDCKDIGLNRKFLDDFVNSEYFGNPEKCPRKETTNDTGNFIDPTRTFYKAICKNKKCEVKYD